MAELKKKKRRKKTKRKKRDPATIKRKGFTVPIKTEQTMIRNMFGRYITQRRKELNISNHELSKRAGVHSYRTFKWESGEEFPAVTSVRRLAKALEVGDVELRKQIALGKMFRIMNDYGFITPDRPNDFKLTIKRQKTGNGKIHGRAPE